MDKLYVLYLWVEFMQ